MLMEREESACKQESREQREQKSESRRAGGQAGRRAGGQASRRAESREQSERETLAGVEGPRTMYEVGVMD